MTGAATVTDPIARPRVDPRFARRWVEVRREAGKRRLRVVLAGVVVLAVLLIAVGILYSPLLKVRHVHLQVGGAAGSISAADVQRLTGLDHYKLMADVDTSALTHRLDAIPVLGGARVSKKWPGTVTVSVDRRAALAQVSLGGPSTLGAAGWATVDTTGRVLADVAHQVAGLPILTGVGVVPAPGRWLSGTLGPDVLPGTSPGADVTMNAPADSASIPRGAVAALAAIQALPASVRAEIISVGTTPTGELTISVLPASMAAGSIPVDLGDGSLLAEKLTSLETLLSKANLAGVVSIDLTDPNRPATLNSAG